MLYQDLLGQTTHQKQKLIQQHLLLIMSTPLAKRRRLDVASSTLSKPFRSPFKTPLKTNSITTKAASEPSNQETPLVHKTTSITPSYKPVINKTIHQFSPQVSTPTSTLRKKATTTRGRFASPLVTATLNTDPEITSLIKKQRELEKKLRELKEELDVAEQARKIEVKSEKKGDKEVDGELKELVGKWKSASRGAAEDLFGGVKDRINKYAHISLILTTFSYLCFSKVNGNGLMNEM